MKITLTKPQAEFIKKECDINLKSDCIVSLDEDTRRAIYNKCCDIEEYEVLNNEELGSDRENMAIAIGNLLYIDKN